MTRRDFNLERLPDWRYCRIPYGQKGPRYANWQNQPFTLAEVPEDMNIGLLLGAPSNGIMAVDFDGPSAWDYWCEHIGPIPKDTVTWSSGKPGRCQMAFSVDATVWSMLTTKKIATAEGEGLEFRWTGGQSVLPPSMHPDTQKPYFWVLSPTEVDISPLPLPALLYWHSYNHAPAVATAAPVEQGDIADITEEQFETLNQALTVIKSGNPVLPYDDWMRVTFAVAKTIGNAGAEEVMKIYWPEKTPGEYRTMLRSRSAERSPGIGSLIFKARAIDPNFMKAEKKTITTVNPYGKVY